MKKILLLFLMIPGLLTISAAQVKQSVTKSTITFEIKNLGINVQGNLNGLQADINFDPANIAASGIDATVEVKTVNSNSDMRDNHLKEEEYFDAARYPTIRMKSTAFKHKSGANFIGEFDVTIKGKTKAVSVPFQYTEVGKTGTFTGKFKINRLDFGVGGKSLILSDEVTVSVDIETGRQ